MTVMCQTTLEIDALETGLFKSPTRAPPTTTRINALETQLFHKPAQQRAAAKRILSHKQKCMKRFDSADHFIGLEHARVPPTTTDLSRGLRVLDTNAPMKHVETIWGPRQVNRCDLANDL